MRGTPHEAFFRRSSVLRWNRAHPETSSSTIQPFAVHEEDLETPLLPSLYSPPHPHTDMDPTVRAIPPQYVPVTRAQALDPCFDVSNPIDLHGVRAQWEAIATLLPIEEQANTEASERFKSWHSAWWKSFGTEWISLVRGGPNEEWLLSCAASYHFRNMALGIIDGSTRTWSSLAIALVRSLLSRFSPRARHR